MSVYTDNLEVGDGSEMTRRVMVKGDPIHISYNDLTENTFFYRAASKAQSAHKALPAPPANKA